MRPRTRLTFERALALAAVAMFVLIMAWLVAEPAKASTRLRQGEALQTAAWVAPALGVTGLPVRPCEFRKANVRVCTFADGQLRVRESGNGYFVVRLHAPPLEL